ASFDVVRRYAKELYYLGLWMTPEFAILIANAPDTDGFTLEHSEHYAHCAQNLADVAGYLRDPNHVLMMVVSTRALGIPFAVQRRVRQAVEHTILTNEWRALALNRWLE